MLKNKISQRLLVIGATAALFTAACSSIMPSEETTASASADAIKAAVGSELRADQAKRDNYRNPADTLEFFGLKDDMTVVEISPGGGWYTTVLNPIVKDNGKFYAAHFHMYEGAPGYYQRSLDGFKKKMAENPLYSGIELTEFHHTKALDVAPEGSADMVLTFRNVHNWYMNDGDMGVENAFRAFHKALKSGGVLGVVEHRMPEELDQAANKRSGYMKQSYVVAIAEKAGFKLAASSEVNANPKDTALHPRGVWTLPPRLALGDQDRDKYIAIGESDRMTLKFVKQ